MAFGRDDDTGLHLIALLGAAIIIVMLLASCQAFTPKCPEGSTECPESPCGCCIGSDVCSACGENLIEFRGACCDKDNLENCIYNPRVCPYPSQCAINLDCMPIPSCPFSTCEFGVCKPCERGALCNPSIPGSCCKGMECTSQGVCEPCQDLPCSSDLDCCGNYECSLEEGLCKGCDRPCTISVPGIEQGTCCDGWQCTAGQCQDCVASCDPEQGIRCACDGYVCENGLCAGCVEGAYCDASNPCCSGFECNSETNKCEACQLRPCVTSVDCCDEYACIGGLCYGGDSACTNIPCTNPGEKPCSPCAPDGVCIGCDDDTICARNPDLSSANMFVCQGTGRCAVGVPCQPGSRCDCCDATTGDCVCEVGHPCETIEGCDCCTYEPRTITVCPKDTYLCPGMGCAGISEQCVPRMQGGDVYYECTPATQPLCDQGTFACTGRGKESSCCTLIVPADAIPSGVYAVDTSTGCKSGYEERIFLFGQPMTACCGVSYSRESANLYKYAFGCLSEHIGYSQIAPYEQVVSTTMHLDDGYCTSYMQACIGEGVPLSECFRQPIEVIIG